MILCHGTRIRKHIDPYMDRRSHTLFNHCPRIRLPHCRIFRIKARYRPQKKLWERIVFTHFYLFTQGGALFLGGLCPVGGMREVWTLYYGSLCPGGSLSCWGDEGGMDSVLRESLSWGISVLLGDEGGMDSVLRESLSWGISVLLGGGGRYGLCTTGVSVLGDLFLGVAVWGGVGGLCAGGSLPRGPFWQ